MLRSITAASRRALHALRPWLQMRRAVRLVWESGPIWTAASGVLRVLAGLQPLLALGVMRLIVEAVAAAVSAPDIRAAFHYVLIIAGVAAAVAVLTAVREAVATLVGVIQSQTVTDHLH